MVLIDIKSLSVKSLNIVIYININNSKINLQKYDTNKKHLTKNRVNVKIFYIKYLEVLIMIKSEKEIIKLNEKLMRRIVYAINKAITEDVPEELRNNWLETNNRCRFANGDYINNNLRNHVVNEDIKLVPFRRFVYDGRIIIDQKNKITYSIVTFETLKKVKKLNKNNPHYLQTLLFIENRDCVSSYKQMRITDYIESDKASYFTEEEYIEDYNDIMQGEIRNPEQYKHYIIAYSYKKSEVSKVKLLYLDKDFDIIDSCDLREFITPDFANLTQDRYYERENAIKVVGRKQHTFKLRQGVKTSLK